MTDSPYGSWSSPITASFIVSSGVRLGSPSVDSDGSLHWLEGRPQEQGRHAVVKYVGAHSAYSSEQGTVDVTPMDMNVRSSVHEYGGGAYVLAPAGGVIFSDFATARLYWVGGPSGQLLCLTPEEGWKTGRYRFADGSVEPSGERIILVREDHGEKGDAKPADVVNEIVAVALDGSGEMQVLATGRDFYAAPRVSPDGKWVAYVCWDHPSMPWDATQLRLASLEHDDPTTSSHHLVDGQDEDTSVLQPAWHPKSGALYYISDASGFYSLRRLRISVSAADDALRLRPSLISNVPDRRSRLDAHPRLASASTFALIVAQLEPHTLSPPPTRCSLALFCRLAPDFGDSIARREALKPTEPLPPRAVDFGGSSPGWSLGQQGFAFLADGRVAASVPDRSSGQSRLLVFPDADGSDASIEALEEFGVDDGLPHNFGGIAPAQDGTLYLLGGGPDAPTGVFAWRGLVDAGCQSDKLFSSLNASFPDGFCSIPQPVEFESTLGTAYGFYYPPTNPNYFSSEAAPPLLVKAHGGPTAATSALFNPAIQFWTSRGFAVLDVDYGGSTGYGRDYRRRLRGQWGIVDIDDVCAGAQALVKRGLADGARLAIDGGSAGGFTTLGALAFRDVFTAGCSLYGVADLSVLARDTHKFESRYLDGLVGRLPEDQAIFDARAPVNAVDTLSCPVLLLQGDQDNVVPPNQALLMHEALLKKGLPCALKIYKGEQHGFRKAENIEDALNSELYFYSKVFGFECSGDDVVPFPIDNL